MEKRAKDENWLSVSAEKRAHAVDTARRLRHDGTRGEALLWQALRNRKLAGMKFRRQQPIGSFIVDFYCAERSLAIEVDGSIHEGREGHDFERQRLIEATGVRILRVAEEEVRTDLEAVLRKIAASIQSAPPPLRSSERGSGGEVTPLLRSSERGSGGEVPR